MNAPELITYTFKDDGTIPNNRALPVVHYPGALADDPERAEHIFNGNGWGNSWTNGVFDYHHYHSNSHEVLGVMRGSAVVQLGGSLGRKVELGTGDVLILPAGTGHMKLSASPDFLVAGAYPGDMDHNLLTGAPGERPQALEDIARVPLPEFDPAFGADGPLLRLWEGLF